MSSLAFHIAFNTAVNIIIAMLNNTYLDTTEQNALEITSMVLKLVPSQFYNTKLA